jgi:hypothetical protein
VRFVFSGGSVIKKFNSTIVIALGTSAALIAFAFDQRRPEPTVTVPEVSLYIAAAVICLLPVLVALVRHKTWLRS